MTQTRLPARAQDARAGSRIAHAQVRPAGGFHAAMCMRAAGVAIGGGGGGARAAARRGLPTGDTHRGSGERDEQPGVAAAWSVCARQGEVPLSVTTGCSRALRARTVGVLGRSARKRGASKVPLRLARPHSNLADLETGTARCQHTPTASGNWKRQHVVRSHHGDRTPAQHAQIIVCGACGRFAGRAGIATATTQRL